MKIFSKNTSDKKHSEIINMLKELPRVETPDNFEYNLMVKIKNGEFEDSKLKQRKIKLSSVLKPAFAALTAAVIVFFVNDLYNYETVNPLMEAPRAKIKNAKNFADNNKKTEKNIVSQENGYTVIIKPNDVVEIKTTHYPFDKSNSIDLDTYIRGETPAGSNQRTMLVGGGNRALDFEGFVVYNELEQKLRKLYKAKLDSIMRNSIKADSLQK